MSDKIERTFIISDIHGCIDEFREMLYLTNAKCNRIILVGDLEDRGPASTECVALARELKLESVLGNHSLKYLKWLRRTDSKKNEALIRQPHYAQFSKDDIGYMERMPLYIKIPEQDTIVVHAGVKPYLPIERQSREDLCYLRYTDKNGKFISIRKIRESGSISAANAVFWTSRGSFKNIANTIVYGHSVFEDGINIKKFEDGSECIGIDGGCCFGMSLNSICLETREVISVKAKKVYYEPGFKIQ